MDKDTLSSILAKKLAGEATPEELQRLQEYLEAHPGEQGVADLLELYWLASPDAASPGTPAPEDRFNRILRMAAEQTPAPPAAAAGKNRRLLFPLLLAAAAVALVFFAVNHWSGREAPPGPAPDPVIIAAARGARTKMVLPDRSEVWLNSDSKLYYPARFSDTLRTVQLEGEGYFIVTKDAARPFVVQTAALNVRVLGTVFTVKSYPADQQAETTLLEGSVAVERNMAGEQARIILQPRQKLTLGIAPGTNPEMTVTDLPKDPANEAIPETAWVYGRLAFDGTRFSDLAVIMERWYDKKITIADPEVADLRFTGVFEEETLEEALKALQQIAPFRFETESEGIRITRN